MILPKVKPEPTFQPLVYSLPLIEQMEIFDHLTKRFVKFKLWPKQRQMLELIHRNEDVIILKKRQVGASQLCGADSLVQIMSQENWVNLVISVAVDDAKEYLARICQMFERLPKQMKKAYPIKFSSTEAWSPWDSRIIVVPARKGFGYTANRVTIDEAGKINPKRSNVELDTVMMNIGATIDKTDGQILMVSTAEGMNEFHKRYMEAKRGKPRTHALFFGCYDDPTFTESKRAELVAKHGEKHVNQEYPRTDLEAFLSSGTPRFNQKTLAEHYTPLAPKTWVRGFINTKDSLIVDRNSNLRVFKKLKKMGQYAIFADVAEGVKGGDYSCAKVIDLDNWNQVAEWHGHCDPGAFGTELALISQHWNNAYIVPEVNNHGTGTLVELRRGLHYPDDLLFQGKDDREQSDDVFNKPERRFGFLTNGLTRKLIIDGLAERINKAEIPYFLQEDIDELYHFVRKTSGEYAADTGYHDDRVMTLAIAYHIAPFLRRINLGARSQLQTEDCVTCKRYDKLKKMCTYTKRPVFNPEGTWCHKFQEDTGWLDHRPPSKHLNAKGYRPLVNLFET